ncbi:MAG: hypothetical protein ACOYBD_02525 [Bilifractor sp.]|jgi:hypothetical protein
MKNNIQHSFTKIPLTALIAVMTGSALLLGGCGKAASSESVALSSVTETPAATEAVASASVSALSASSVEKEAEKIIGTKAEGTNIVRMELTNETGKAVTGFAVKYTGQESYGDNMIPSGETYEAGETRTLYYDESEALKSVNAQTESDSAPVVNPDYSIQLTFDDQTTLELHSVPLNDIKSASILLNTENSFLFLKYVSSSTGETISTEDSEKAVLEASQATPTPTQAPTEQPAAETQQAEQSAAEQPAESTYTAPSDTYTAPSETYTDPSATYTEPSTPDTTDSGAGQAAETPAPVNTDQGADSGEGCIDNGLTW